MSEPKIRCISGSYANTGESVHAAIAVLQARDMEAAIRSDEINRSLLCMRRTLREQGGSDVTDVPPPPRKRPRKRP